MRHKWTTPVAVLSSMAILSASWLMMGGTSASADSAKSFQLAPTNSPIKHVVVIFDENVSFDHYFATYPNALNPAGESKFVAAPNTPSVNGLSGSLLTQNPNGANPQRLDPSQAETADMDHGYTDEQTAMDGGLMDQFVKYGGKGNSVVMDYYDGNTVTGLWNYAQHFAMSDNSFGTTFGPSSPGAINLISGQTHGAVAYTANVDQNGLAVTGNTIKGKLANGTLYSDADPYYDKTSSGTTVAMTGVNVGDLMNEKNVTWGWFEGGFRDSSEQHTNVGSSTSTDYIPHHEPFQYYKSTANPEHLPPSSPSLIGQTDQANHQYDLTDFWTAAQAGNLPAVSFLKAPGYQDGHAGYSDPIDEQVFLTNTINGLEQLPSWRNTAVIISYDDSDGWYDHVMPPIVNGSNDPNADTLDGQGNAGKTTAGAYLDRAGYGPRLPLLVISPYAKQNFVDNTLTDQSSILKFIEDNWNLGTIGDQSSDAWAGTLGNMFNLSQPTAPELYLNPNTGESENQGQAKKQWSTYIAKLFADAGVSSQP